MQVRSWLDYLLFYQAFSVVNINLQIRKCRDRSSGSRLNRSEMNEIRNVVSSSNLIGVIKRNAFNNKTLKLRNVVNKFLRFECLSFVNQNLMKILIIRTNLSFGKNPIYKFRQNFIKRSSTTSKLIKWHDILKFNLKKNVSIRFHARDN